MWYSTEQDSNNLDFSQPIVAVDPHTEKVKALLIKADKLFFWMDTRTGSSGNTVYKTREAALSSLAPHLRPMNAVRITAIIEK